MHARSSVRDRDGVAVIVLHGDKVLALKRISIPLLMEFPGDWSLLMGAREPGESHETTVFRELFEETGIQHADVSEIDHLGSITLHSRGIFHERHWENELFILRSTTPKIRLNFENSAFEWLVPKALMKRGTLNAFEPDARASIIREIHSRRIQK